MFGSGSSFQPQQQQQPQQQGLFGSSSALNPAGSTAPVANQLMPSFGGGFGSTSGGSSSGLFGAGSTTGLTGTAASSGSAFGGASGGLLGTAGLGGASSGLSSTTGFGGVGAFGSAAASAPMQQPTSNTVNNGTANPKYQVTVERDGAVNVNYNIISASVAYRNYSFEELRLRDYELNLKNSAMGSSVSTSTSGLSSFGGVSSSATAPATSTTGFGGFGSGTSGAFGSSASTSTGNIFQQKPVTGGFGSAAPASSTSIFGAGASATPFGSTATAPQTGFGQQPSTPAASTGFGAGGFGAGFGQQPASTPATTGFGGFGGQPSTTTAPSTGSIFGSGAAPSTSGGGMFGSGTSGFGAPATGGGLGFGAGGATNTMGFGSTASTAAKPSFGFGQTPSTTTTGFGTTPSTIGGFGQPATQPGTSSLFGSQLTAAPAASGTGLFGQTPSSGAPATSGFGFGQQTSQPAAATTSGFSFGGGQQTTSTLGTGGLLGATPGTGTSLFGQPAASGATSSFGFGQQQKPATTSPFQTTGGLGATGAFGTATQQPQAQSGGLFGGFGGQQQQQQQQPSTAQPSLGTTGGFSFGSGATTGTTGATGFGAGSTGFGAGGLGTTGTLSTTSLFQPTTGTTGSLFGGQQGSTGTSLTSTIAQPSTGAFSGFGGFGTGATAAATKPATQSFGFGSTLGTGLMSGQPATTSSGFNFQSSMQSQQQPSLVASIDSNAYGAGAALQPSGSGTQVSVPTPKQAPAKKPISIPQFRFFSTPKSDAVKFTSAARAVSQIPGTQPSSTTTAARSSSTVYTAEMFSAKKSVKTLDASVIQQSQAEESKSRTQLSFEFSQPIKEPLSSKRVSFKPAAETSVLDTPVRKIDFAAAAASHKQPSPSQKADLSFLNNGQGNVSFESQSSSFISSTVGTPLKSSAQGRSVTSASPKSILHMKKSPGDSASQAHGEYYTIPKLKDLYAAASKGSDSLSSIPNFVIGRHGYGKIAFLEPVDLEIFGFSSAEEAAEKIFGNIVVIQTKFVSVYDDDGNDENRIKKHPMGSGLNHPARITLPNIFAVDKRTQSRINSSLIKSISQSPNSEELISILKQTVNAHRRKLQSFTESRFIEWTNCFDGSGKEEGVWTFDVDHFSRYGLLDEDDDDEIAPAGQKDVPIQNLEFVPAPEAVAEINDLDRFSNMRRQLQFGESLSQSAVKFQGEASSLRRKAQYGRTTAPYQKERRNKLENISFQEQSLDMEQSILADDSSQPSFLNTKKDAVEIMPETEEIIAEPPSKHESPKVLEKDYSLPKKIAIDQDFAIAREYVLAKARVSSSMKTDIMVPFKDSGRLPPASFVSRDSCWILNVSGRETHLNRLPQLASRTHHLTKSLDYFMKKFSGFSSEGKVIEKVSYTDKITALEYLKEAQKDESFLSLYDKQYWELFDALFTPVSSDLYPAELGTDHLDFSKFIDGRRKHALSKWLVGILAPSIDEHVEFLQSDRPVTDAIAKLMSCYKTEDATLFALRNDLLYLGSIISQAGGDAPIGMWDCIGGLDLKSRNSLYHQVQQKDFQGGPQLQYIYRLLAGDLDWLCNASIKQNIVRIKSWQLLLGISLWYFSMPGSPLSESVSVMVSFLDSIKCEEDAMVRMLQTFGGYCSAEELVFGGGFEKQDSWLLPWITWLLLEFGSDANNAKAADDDEIMEIESEKDKNQWKFPACGLRITTLLVAELEDLGLWHYAIFVATHLPNREQAEIVIKRILDSHVSYNHSDAAFTELGWNFSPDLFGKQWPSARPYDDSLMKDADSIEYLERESMVLKNIGIPKEWIYDAKAEKSKFTDDYFATAAFLIQAGRKQDALPFVQRMVERSFVMARYETLKVLVQIYPDHFEVYRTFLRLIELPQNERLTSDQPLKLKGVLGCLMAERLGCRVEGAYQSLGQRMNAVSAQVKNLLIFKTATAMAQ